MSSKAVNSTEKVNLEDVIFRVDFGFAIHEIKVVSSGRLMSLCSNILASPSRPKIKNGTTPINPAQKHQLANRKVILNMANSKKSMTSKTNKAAKRAKQGEEMNTSSGPQNTSARKNMEVRKEKYGQQTADATERKAHQEPNVVSTT